MELELATVPQILQELHKRPHEKCLHFHQIDGGEWEIFGHNETDIDQAAIMLSA